MNQSISEDRIEVRTFFKEGGKIIGTERCSTIEEAKQFAIHALKYFPYVEVVFIHGVLHPFDIYEVRSSEVLFSFK